MEQNVRLTAKMRKRVHAIKVIVLTHTAIAFGFQTICPETPKSESINLTAPSSRTHFSRMSRSAGKEEINS